MKKYLFIIISLFLCVNSVSALTMQNENTIINSTGAEMTKKQFDDLSAKYSESFIEKLSQKDIKNFSNNNVREEYSITTYKLDKFGNVVDEITIVATKAEAETVATNPNLHVMGNGVLLEQNPEISTMGYVDNYTYQTESKVIYGYYSSYVDPNTKKTKYVMQVMANWIKVPKIRVFDVLALRWNNDVNITSLDAYQDADSNTGITRYTLNGTNTKKTSKGVGVSMNIHDSVKSRLELFLQIESEQYFGYDFFATYQHAKNSNATLAISQSYTFGPSGLGGVLVFGNSTYRSYYDDMQGIKYHYEG